MAIISAIIQIVIDRLRVRMKGSKICCPFINRNIVVEHNLWIVPYDKVNEKLRREKKSSFLNSGLQIFFWQTELHGIKKKK